MKLTVVGCSSGMPSPNLAHSCYLVKQAGYQYMFDCGGGAASALRRCGIDTSTIRSVFISHTHPDHVSGIPMFLQMEYLMNREEPLSIYIPSEFQAVFSSMLRGMYLFKEKLRFDVTIHPIDDGFSVDHGSVRVSALRNSHLGGHREFLESKNYDNRMQCFSFTVEAEGKKLAYSADIGKTDDLDPIADHADLLVTEGMHLDLDALPDLLLKNNVRQCMLTHLPDDFDRETTRIAFSKAGYENVGFASEGLELTI